MKNQAIAKNVLILESWKRCVNGAAMLLSQNDDFGKTE